MRTDTAPRMSEKASTANPGSGSAILASPMGVNGESRMAVGTVRNPATTPMIVARSVPSVDSCARDMPSARSVGSSADSR
jgi:hypothetical protein